MARSLGSPGRMAGRVGVIETRRPYLVSARAFDRTIIFGNTASGKSWLSHRLGQKLAAPVVDLDLIRWVGGDYSGKETVQTAIAKTVAQAQGDRWIIEGVYGWLITPILAHATCVIWTDIPWAQSRENLLARETARGSSGNFAELEAWSGDYWTRQSASCYAAHLEIFEGFSGTKFRLSDMSETSGFTARIADL